MVSEDNTTNEGSMNGQPGLTGIRENWTRILVDLSDYNGYGSVRFRFRFTSDNDASAFAFEKDDGFYIDNLKLVKTTGISTVAVKFAGFNAQLLLNNTVKLDWEAYTDVQHDYFEVQRSTDVNHNFIPLARIKSQPPYSALDYSPETGNNYYRIKEVDKNGGATYTNVIKITLQHNLTTSIYPNPVRKELAVKIRNNINRENYVIRITDATGRAVYEQTKMIEAGASEVKIDVNMLASQVYFLKLINSKNEVVVNDKFIKQ